MTANEIKMVRSLSQKKYRDQYGMFVVEGRKLVAEAQACGLDIVDIYSEENVGPQTMARISSMSSPSPVVAVVRKPALKGLEKPYKGLYLALDAVRDPGNLGTIIRIADWFALDGVIASEDTAELFNPKVLQASMGSAFRVKFVRCALKPALAGFRAQGIPVYGTFLNGENIYRGTYSKDAVIVMGNEANGIGDQVASEVDRRITIPSFGAPTESLNVSVATAICVSEFRR